MNTQHTHDTWIGKATSSDQGLIYSEQTGKNIAVCYDPKNTALIAAAPALLHALQVIQANPNDPWSHRVALDAMNMALEAQQ